MCDLNEMKRCKFSFVVVSCGKQSELLSIYPSHKVVRYGDGQDTLSERYIKHCFINGILVKLNFEKGFILR